MRRSPYGLVLASLLASTAAAQLPGARAGKLVCSDEFDQPGRPGPGAPDPRNRVRAPSFSL